MYSSFLSKEFIHKNRLVLAGIILIGVVNSIVTFLLPVSIGNFFILQFGSEGSKGRLLQLLGIHFSSLPAFFIFFFALIGAKAFTGMIERWVSLREGEKFIKMVRERLFEAQIKSSTESFSEKSYGSYLLRYSNDLKAIKDYLLKGRLETWESSMFLLVGIGLLCLLQLQLSFYLITFFIVIVVAFIMLSRYQKKYISESRNRRSNLLAFVTKSFSRHLRIKQQVTEENSINRFRLKSEKLYEANMENNKLESLQQSLVPVLQFTMLGFLLWISTFLKPAINYSDALVYVLVTLMLMSSMRRILKVPGYLNKGNISLQKIEELLMQELAAPAAVKKETITA